MVATSKKAVAKNSVIANTIESSVANLEVALDKVTRAVSVKSTESKKLMIESRRLKKRRASLVGKKKRASAANKKGSTADSRKTLKSIASELATTTKAVAKATTARSAVLEELNGLKQSHKVLAAYMKGIVAAKRKAAKPKKKRRAKRAAA
jgi:hypothetical protein